MNDIINNFIKVNTLTIGGITVSLPENTKKMVKLLISNNQKILGIDGFFITKEGQRPSLEDSLLTFKLYDQNILSEEIQKKIFEFIDERMNKKNLFYEVIFR